MSISSITSATISASSSLYQQQRPNGKSQQQEEETTKDAGSANRLDSAKDTEKAHGSTGKVLTEKEQQEVDKLVQRDREVRAHEAAHKTAAGQYAQGAASFTYKRGADGVNYAVSGEVRIDTAPVPDDPEATLKKAETVQRAALAPAEPSQQDYAVAAEASRMATDARADIQEQNAEALNEAATKDTHDEEDESQPIDNPPPSGAVSEYKMVSTLAVDENTQSMVDMLA